MTEHADPWEPSEPRPSDDVPDGPGPDDVFADLVAHFNEEPLERGWPAAEDVATGRPPGLGDLPTSPDDPVVGGHPVFSGDPRALGYADDPDGEHYVPPPPPRAGRIRPGTAVALLAIALGIAVLALPEIVSAMTDNPTQEVVGVVLILAGLGLLVARMGGHRPGDDDPDDNGAVL